MLVTVLALAGFACADGVGQMLTDAGEVLTDGAVPNAGAQDEPVTCNKTATDQLDGLTITYRWAEFDVDPGVTEVTICYEGGGTAWTPSQCSRYKPAWLRGTTTGRVSCGTRYDYDDPDTPDFDTPDPISITVHR
jgi:hypothetical protein